MKTAVYEDEIKARVQSATPVQVFVNDVPDDVPTPAYPYVVLYFGGPVRGFQDHHITSSRSDTMIAYATVQVVSITDISARDVMDLVRDSLMGFIPTNCGELVCEGALGYNNAQPNVPPTKFFRESGWTWRTNLQFNG